MGKTQLRVKLKLLRLIIFFFVFLIIFALVIGISRAGGTQNAQNTEDDESSFSTLIPQNLEISEKDYKQLEEDYPQEIERLGFGSNGAVNFAAVNSGAASSGSANTRLAEDQSSNADSYSKNDTAASTQETVQNYIPQAFRTDNSYSSASSFQDRLQVLQNLLSRKNGTGSLGQNTSHIDQGRKSTLFVSSGTGVQNLLSDPQNLLAGAADSASRLIDFPEQKSLYDQQNSQEAKNNFLQSKQSRSNDFSSIDTYTTLDTSRTIVAGSTIPVVLLTEINSDLPGKITGRVVEDVYDSFQGLNVLIPKGTLLVGSYDSQISWGQLRVLVVWERLTRPDGVALSLPGAQGIDDRGSSGIISNVNTNIGASIGVAALSSLFQLGVEYGASYAYNSTGSQALSDSLRTSSNNALSSTTELAYKLLERQPTLTVKQGTVSQVFVHRDIELPAFQR